MLVACIIKFIIGHRRGEIEQLPHLIWTKLHCTFSDESRNSSSYFHLNLLLFDVKEAKFNNVAIKILPFTFWQITWFIICIECWSFTKKNHSILFACIKNSIKSMAKHTKNLPTIRRQITFERDFHKNVFVGHD